MPPAGAMQHCLEQWHSGPMEIVVAPVQKITLNQSSHREYVAFAQVSKKETI